MIEQVRSIFEKHADPGNAVNMKKYMKNRYEFFGIKTPVRKEILKPIYRKALFGDFSELEKMIKKCWDQPEREFQYFAMNVADRNLKLVDRDNYDIYHYMLTHKSWWDTVDMISTHLVGTHINRFPELKSTLHQQWLYSDNIWLQRTMILYQLKYKEKTDVDQLKNNILHCRHSDEFFIQKAIGWALREFSKTDRDWVIEFVEKQELKPLSKREALKWLNKRDS